ncbi:MAG: ABC transporter permease subunit [Myxococcaceae bacterium]|nr:ABC transporter permease subunit [Myxococcaceae bacterium]
MRALAGLGLLGALAALALAHAALSGGAVACPFGVDPQLPFETVCAQAVGGLWRSAALGLTAGAGGCVLAVAFALLGRRLGKGADLAVEKLAELFFAIPDVLVLISLGFVARAVKGGESVSLPWMMVALTAIGWAAPTRMVQNRLRSLERLDFIAAARALGVPEGRLLLRHLMPMAWDFLLAIFLMRVPAIILTESTVSYLGFGLPVSEPSLGKYLGSHWGLLLQGNWEAVVPAWALLVAMVLGFQQVGRGLLERSEGGRR